MSKGGEPFLCICDSSEFCQEPHPQHRRHKMKRNPTKCGNFASKRSTSTLLDSEVLLFDRCTTEASNKGLNLVGYARDCLCMHYDGSLGHKMLLSARGPLNRLTAILSLLQPLDRYRAPSAIESAIGRPYLALSRIHAQAGALNRLVLNRLGGSTAR